jgi:hypothetical protein
LLVELISYVAMAIAVVCGAVGTVSGIIGIVAKIRKTRDPRRFARIATVLGSAVLLIYLMGVGISLILTNRAAEAQGLTQSDRQRIISNGVAESLYNMVLGLVLGGTPCVLGLLGRVK